jgi:integrase
MAVEIRGSVFTTADGGYGIRWPENGRRLQQSGFRTKREARRWFSENVKPRLERGGPSPDITYDAFCELFLTRHNASARTIATIAERLMPSRAAFGDWRLSEIERAADDIARWRATLTPTSRYRLTLAMRQVLGAGVRWRYLTRNPAVDAGPNPEPRGDELRPFTPGQIGSLAIELGMVYGPLAIFAAETGLRTNEWVALQRRDIDRSGRRQAVVVQRRFADGVLTPYPKTARRRVPLSARAMHALDTLPARVDTPLLFAAVKGGYINLDNWRTREWYPALDAAGIDRRGPYHLRHTFATEALASGMTLFQLARVMGASAKTIDKHYGHLAHDSEESIGTILDAASARSGVELASGFEE